MPTLFSTTSRTQALCELVLRQRHGPVSRVVLCQPGNNKIHVPSCELGRSPYCSMAFPFDGTPITDYSLGDVEQSVSSLMFFALGERGPGDCLVAIADESLV